MSSSGWKNWGWQGTQGKWEKEEHDSWTEGYTSTGSKVQKWTQDHKPLKSKRLKPNSYLDVVSEVSTTDTYPEGAKDHSMRQALATAGLIGTTAEELTQEATPKDAQMEDTSGHENGEWTLEQGVSSITLTEASHVQTQRQAPPPPPKEGAVKTNIVKPPAPPPPAGRPPQKAQSPWEFDADDDTLPRLAAMLQEPSSAKQDWADSAEAATAELKEAQMTNWREHHEQYRQTLIAQCEASGNNLKVRKQIEKTLVLHETLLAGHQTAIKDFERVQRCILTPPCARSGDNKCKTEGLLYPGDMLVVIVDEVDEKMIWEKQVTMWGEEWRKVLTKSREPRLRYMCKPCYEDVQGLTTPITGHQWRKLQEKSRTQLNYVVADEGKNAFAEMDNVWKKMYGLHKGEMKKLLQDCPVFRRMIERIKSGSDEHITKRREVVAVTIADFNKCMKEAVATDKTFGSNMLDNAIRMHKRAIAAKQFQLYELITMSADWHSVKFRAGGAGPRIIACYAQCSTSVNGKRQALKYWDQNGDEHFVHTTILPVSQTHWYYTHESQSNKWRSMANGEKIFVGDGISSDANGTKVREGDACMILGYCLPEKDSAGNFVTTVDEKCKITLIRTIQPLGVNKAVLDLMCGMSNLIGGELPGDDIDAVFRHITESVAENDKVQRRLLMSIDDTRFTYMAQPPERGSDYQRHLQAGTTPPTLTHNQVEGALLGGVKHYKTPLEAYNLDMVAPEVYEHHDIKGSKLWSAVVQACSEHLSTAFLEKLAFVAQSKKITKAHRSAAYSLVPTWMWNKIDNPPSEEELGKFKVKAEKEGNE